MTANGYMLAVVCVYDDWDEDVYEEIRLVPSTPGKEADVDPLKARAPQLTIRVDGWEWTADARPFFGGGQLYLWANVRGDLYQRLSSASGQIRATVTLSSPSATFADQSFSAKGSAAAIRAYRKGCNELW